MKLQLTLRSCSPLALSESRANEQFAGGLDYIPGSTLRGALAAAYLQEAPDQKPDESFRVLFLSSQVKYPDLLPTPVENHLSEPFPATTQACKRYKLKHPGSLQDILFKQALLSTKVEAWEQKPDLELEEALAPQYCPDCQKENRQTPLHHYSGYFTVKQTQPYTLRPTPPIHRRLLAGTSISRIRGVTQQGMLFSREVLEEDQFFSGEIQVLDDLAEDIFHRLLRLVQSETIVRVGYGRSRGLGKLQIVSCCQRSNRSDPSLRDRWQAFNRKAWQSGLSQAKVYFSLTLLSDWIQRGNSLYLSEALPNGIELGLPQAALERGVVNSTLVMGWNAAAGLPKESQPALKRGSALLFSLPGDGAQIAQAQAHLTQLEMDGLGERRNEGFGRVRICHPFHYESLTPQE